MVPEKGAQTAVSGSVVVYTCNDARYAKQYCRSSTANTVVNYLEDHCSLYRAGKSGIGDPCVSFSALIYHDVVFVGEYIYSQGTAPNGNGVRTFGYTAKGKGICYGLTG